MTSYTNDWLMMTTATEDSPKITIIVTGDQLQMTILIDDRLQTTNY